MPIQTRIVNTPSSTWSSYETYKTGGSWVPSSAATAGSLPIGDAHYAVPTSGTVFYVAPNGNDANNGTNSATPKATLAAAIAVAQSGATIVLRQGEYRENVGSITNKQLTIQNYPGEAVWFDGTDIETNWTSDTGRWRAPLTVEFSHTAGFSEGNDETSRFTDTDNPLAAWPDMVFIDGIRQWQVASNPSAGQFSVDYASDLVWIGTDPAGKEVRVTKRGRWLICNGKCIIRGIGVRRYATVMWEIGTLYIGSAGGGTIVENCYFEDSATQAISANGIGTQIRQCTILRPGQTGIHSNNSDNLVVARNRILNHNWEKFKTQPHCGGVKVTKSGNLTIEWNILDGGANDAYNIWLDDSCWEGKITNNLTMNGDGGLLAEASGRIIIAGNRFIGAVGTYFGILLTISQECSVFNNWSNDTDGYCYAVWQDNRQASASERFYDQGLRWWVIDNRFVNNVAGGSHRLFQWYNRLDTSAPAIDYDRMVIQFESNVFAATVGQNPPTGASRLAGYVNRANQFTYNTLVGFEGATAIATNNQMTTVQAPTDSDMRTFTGSVPLPLNVAAAIGVPTGISAIGPPLPAPIPVGGVL